MRTVVAVSIAVIFVATSSAWGMISPLPHHERRISGPMAADVASSAGRSRQESIRMLEPLTPRA